MSSYHCIGLGSLNIKYSLENHPSWWWNFRKSPRHYCRASSTSKKFEWIFLKVVCSQLKFRILAGAGFRFNTQTYTIQIFNCLHTNFKGGKLCSSISEKKFLEFLQKWLFILCEKSTHSRSLKMLSWFREAFIRLGSMFFGFLA